VGEARALDKQGAGAHGGAVDGASSGFDVSGAVSTGISLYNPSYAARPDNTGLVLMRYAVHADFDLIGNRLSIPLDVNLFSDRLKSGLNKLVPTELDVITGVTSTFPVGPGAMEFGTRIEQDSPLDQGTNGFNQRYVDARTRFLYSMARESETLQRARMDISGWFTLGWFVFNPSYAARPDNTGLALFRYAAHTEFSFFDDLVSAAFDATMFTDRKAERALQPSELDWTQELIVRKAPFEVHLAYERDIPLDRGGLVQSFIYLLGVWAFDSLHKEPPPLENRTHIVSP
jgi:hypothetical protein